MQIPHWLRNLCARYTPATGPTAYAIGDRLSMDETVAAQAGPVVNRGQEHIGGRRLVTAAGPEAVEDGVEAGFEVLGGVTLAEFVGSLDDLGRRLISDRDGDEPFANANVVGARDFPEHRSEREHQ